MTREATLECDCGEIETVQHFLLECPLYEEERDQLLKNLFSQLGINYLDMDLLLGYSENENIPGWRVNHKWTRTIPCQNWSPFQQSCWWGHTTIIRWPYQTLNLLSTFVETLHLRHSTYIVRSLHWRRLCHKAWYGIRKLLEHRSQYTFRLHCSFF